MKFASEKEQLVLINLIQNDKIPKSIFQIDEIHLANYIDAYHSLFGQRNGTSTSTNYRFARKLAGLTLLKYNKHLGAKFSDVLAGMVYLIENPTWPNYFKLGMTLDVHDRLSQYQVYDPLKSFKIVKYEFVLNRREKEKQLLKHPDIITENGEWILRDEAINIFSKICSYS